MYEKTNGLTSACNMSMPEKTSEHMQVAAKIADELINRFSLPEQNDCIKHIVELMSKSRNQELKVLSDRVELIHNSMDPLISK